MSSLRIDVRYDNNNFVHTKRVSFDDNNATASPVATDHPSYRQEASTSPAGRSSRDSDPFTDVTDVNGTAIHTMPTDTSCSTLSPRTPLSPASLSPGTPLSPAGLSPGTPNGGVNGDMSLTHSVSNHSAMTSGYCSDSLHSVDNPFQAGGELHRKADSILDRSTISRDQVRIYDPDTTPTDPDAEAPLLGADQCDGAAGSAPEEPVAPETAAPQQQQLNGSAVEEEPLVARRVEPRQLASPVGADEPAPQRDDVTSVKVKDGAEGKKPACRCCVLQ